MAADLEDLGAAAYLGQATKIKRPDVLRLALSIHTVEGAHAAALAGLADRSITPDGSIAAPADGTEVLEAIKPLLKTRQEGVRMTRPSHIGEVRSRACPGARSCCAARWPPRRCRDSRPSSRSWPAPLDPMS